MIDFNIRSPKQIAEFLFDHCKLPVIKKTTKGSPSVDSSVLIHYAEKENNEFCKLLLQYRRLEKVQNPYLAEMYRWSQWHEHRQFLGHFVHPDLWLNVVETYRSSCSALNLQNIPHHGNIYELDSNSISWNILRKVFTRIGPPFILAEIDYEGAEVKTVANISQDQQLIEDLNNKLDMHSFWTNDIFGWKYEFKEIKAKYYEERHIVKNNWTFANIYKASSKSIADAFRKFDVYKKFVQQKYNEIGKKSTPFHNFYEQYSYDHIADCQKRFFDRYSGLAEWQEDIIKFYYDNGYVESPLGFRRNYPLTSNEIVNFPIQATSFHILLDACIRVNKELQHKKWKSYLIGQIHDSLFCMVYSPEIFEFKEMVDEIMINHTLPINKDAELGTEWNFGYSWENMRDVPWNENYSNKLKEMLIEKQC